VRIGIVSTPWTALPPPAYGGIAPGDNTCPVPLVPNAPPADPDGIGLTEVELAHIVRSYKAMQEMDVIHDHTLIGPLYRNRVSDVPIVTTIHGPFREFLKEIYRAMAPDVALVAISRHQASTADGIRIARVIHHGIDVDAVPVGEGKGGYFCFLGRMSPSKGVREAAMIARKAGVPLRIGAKLQDKGEKEYFECAVAPLLTSEVEYLGELNMDEKYKLVCDATALLNPIQWAEPFGLVMLEALAAGTPVVTTPCGAAPEIVDDGVTGYIREDVDSLAAVLPQAGSLDRRRCREEAQRRFSTECMVAEHLKLYSDLLGGGRA
jgi:glycosyltransferase involved in cell wall biosynthesis